LSIASQTTDLTILYTIDSSMESVSFEPFPPYDQRSRLDIDSYTVAPLLWLWLHSVLYTLYIRVMFTESSH